MLIPFNQKIALFQKELLTFSSSQSVPNEFDKKCDELLLNAAKRYIYYFSYICMIMAPILLIHFYSTDQHNGPHGWLRAVVPTVTTVFIFVCAVRYCAGYQNVQVSRGWLYFVAIYTPVDFFLVCSNNIVFPSRNEFTGLLNLPDPIILIFLILVLPMLQSMRLVILGGGLYALALTLCLTVEKRVYGENIQYTSEVLGLWGCWVLIAILLSVLFTRFMRNLVFDAAANTLQIERANQKLKHLMQEHHDAHSVLSSARLNLDLLSRTIDQNELALLREDLAALEVVVKSIKEDAYEEIAEEYTETIPNVIGCIREILTEEAFRLEGITVISNLEIETCTIKFIKGRIGLKRVLINLLDNSAEGNGQVSADTVSITAKRDHGHLLLVISDNGPGFSQCILDKQTKTTKLTGTGSGLNIVSRLVQNSGGQCQFFNHCGAQVTIRLPLSKSFGE